MKKWTNNCLLVSQVAKSFRSTKKGPTDLWPSSDGSKTRRPILKGCARGREERPHPSCSWQHTEILPIQLTSPGQQVPWSSSLCGKLRDVSRRAQLSKDRLNRAFAHNPPQQGHASAHSSATAPCTCQYLKLKARCSSSTQLECCTRANNQARFMRKEAPISSPLTGIKRSFIQSGAG